METESHLSEFLELDLNYERVSHMKRLGNYIVDLIGFYIMLFFVGIFLGLFFPAVIDVFSSEDFGFPFFENIVTLLLYALYMGASETIFNGRSLGKFVTGTRAVNLDGSAITGKTAFLRGLSRAVPFNAFSALGTPPNPWHDRWTDTMVVSNVKKFDFG